MYISIAVFFGIPFNVLCFYGSSPYVAAYAHVIILHFSSVFANCGVKFFLLVVTCLKKTNVLCIGDGDHMFVVK